MPKPNPPVLTRWLNRSQDCPMDQPPDSESEVAPPHATEEGEHPPESRQPRRRPWVARVAFAVSGLLLIAGGVGGGYLVGRNRAPAASPSPPSASPSPTTDALA